jgi:RND family efflux transporter MFP subunit
MSHDTSEAVISRPEPATTPPAEGASARRRAGRVLAIIGAVVAVLIALRLWGHFASEHTLEKQAQANLALQVVVVSPKPSNAVNELVLPANVQAFVEAPIYARTNGYLKAWYFDIGSRVKKGDLLAEIDTPEEDQQLDEAKAEYASAQANADLAARTADRWESLLKKNAVSKQETDQATSDLTAKKAAADAMAANVRRLEQLRSYEKVYAPFDGVITARETDTGALIAALNAPKELFHLAAVDRLRVFTAVPEDSASAIQHAGEVTLTSDQFPGKVFKGKVTRNAGAIDTATRTLNVEIDIDNKAGDLLPGAYGFVHITVPSAQAPITIPSNTLLFRAQGLQAAVVRDGRAYLVPVKIGHDFGDTVEVASGLTPKDQVILDPPDSILDGALVEATPAK